MFMDKIIEKLKNLKQHHIIKYMENLSSEEYANIKKQFEKLDLSVLTMNGKKEERGKFTPLSAVTLDEISEKGLSNAKTLFALHLSS